MIAKIAKMLSVVSLRQFDTSTPEGRAQERHRRLALTALASMLAKGTSVATLLISVPLTLRYLGPERYGMWMTMSSLIVMMSFADLGIGNGLLNSIAEAHGRDDRVAMRSYISSAYFILSIVAGAILLSFAAIYYVVPWYEIFNVKSQLARQEAGPMVAVFAICFALTIPTAIVLKVQIGLQRGFMANLWQCLASVLGLLGVVVAIWFHARLQWLVLAYVGAPLLGGLCNSVLFFGQLEPSIAPMRSAISQKAIQVIGRLGAMYFILQFVVAVTFSIDNILIAQKLGAVMVVQYAIPERMFSTVALILNMMQAPLWPAYGEALARGDNTWVAHTLRRSLRLAIGYSSISSVALFFLGPTIIRVWAGPVIKPTVLLLLGLAIWKFVEACGQVFYLFLSGVGVLRAQLAIIVPLAVTSLALKLWFIPSMGVAGAVWGTLTANALYALPALCIVTMHFMRTRLEGRNTMLRR